MKPSFALNQAELELLGRTESNLRLVATPIEDGPRTAWVVDVVFRNGAMAMVTTARRKDEYRTWKSLSTLQGFIQRILPELEEFEVLTKSNRPVQ